MSLLAWLPPPAVVSLLDSAVHVWYAALDAPESHLCALEQLVSGDELARAAWFGLPHLRRRFIARRGILWDILARYLRINPRHVCFACTPYGKPFLAPKFHLQPLNFNLSHAESSIVPLWSP